MRMREFIKQHRNEIDTYILSVRNRHAKDKEIPFYPKMNDEERREWILSDELLYRWARGEGIIRSTKSTSINLEQPYSSEKETKHNS